VQPKVSCVMLVCGRPELTVRAIRCFEAQVYEPKELVQYHNTGDRPIGALRNAANALATGEIMCHFDTDDWSHANRVSEQVALLQASGADCVGMNEMLFWRTAIGPIDSVERLSAEDPDSFSAYVKAHDGEAWLYTGTRGGVPALGTSLCYWRKTWERHHFANETQGVEDHWLREKNVVGVSVFGSPVVHNDPRMIARIHGGNTSNGYKLEKYVSKGSKEWQRVPQWDQRIRELLS
jgi:hypothetical protein